jgi:hypothetical protein
VEVGAGGGWRPDSPNEAGTASAGSGRRRRRPPALSTSTSVGDAAASAPGGDSVGGGGGIGQREGLEVPTTSSDFDLSVSSPPPAITRASPPATSMVDGSRRPPMAANKVHATELVNLAATSPDLFQQEVLELSLAPVVMPRAQAQLSFSMRSDMQLGTPQLVGEEKFDEIFRACRSSMSLDTSLVDLGFLRRRIEADRRHLCKCAGTHVQYVGMSGGTPQKVSDAASGIGLHLSTVPVVFGTKGEAVTLLTHCVGATIADNRKMNAPLFRNDAVLVLRQWAYSPYVGRVASKLRLLVWAAHALALFSRLLDTVHRVEVDALALGCLCAVLLYARRHGLLTFQIFRVGLISYTVFAGSQWCAAGFAHPLNTIFHTFACAVMLLYCLLYDCWLRANRLDGAPLETPSMQNVWMATAAYEVVGCAIVFCALCASSLGLSALLTHRQIRIVVALCRSMAEVFALLP